MFLWISIAFVIIFIMYDMYNLYNKKMEDYVVSIFVSLIVFHLIIIALTFFAREFAFPRSILIGSYFVNLIFMFIWRFILYRIYIKKYAKKIVMLIGPQGSINQLSLRMLDEYKQWHEVRYIVTSDNEKLISKYIADVDVVYFIEGSKDDKLSSIVKECIKKDKKVFVIPTFRDVLLSNCTVGNIGDMVTLNTTKFGLNFEERLMKRIIDFVVAFIGIIITLPFMILTALLIKITSKGPVLYKQVRMTKGMKTFEIYKFRTMNIDAEKESGPMLSIEGDSRVTRVGAFLRRVRLDELPQLFNVLKGDMSIVGPRPERPFFVEQFIAENEEYTLRFRVKAGITGLAQVKVKDGPLTEMLNNVIENYREMFSELFKIVEIDKNVGLGNALRIGLKHCKYDIVARMDSDDISLENRFELQIIEFEKNNNLVLLGGQISEFKSDINNIISKRIVPCNYKEILEFSEKRNPFNHVTVMFKKSEILKVGNYENVLLFEDYYLWVKMLQNNCLVANLKKELVRVRIGDEMIKRRGGLLYAKRSIIFQKMIYDIGHISLGRLIINCYIRVITSIAPNRIRRYFYSNALRK